MIFFSPSPNLLQRWSVGDVSALEQSLEAQLARVRAAKQTLVDREQVLAAYVSSLAPPACAFRDWEALDARFRACLDANGLVRPAALVQLVVEVVVIKPTHSKGKGKNNNKKES